MGYYEEQRAAGEAFERYIIQRLQARGLDIRRHEGRAAQLKYGDATRGIEIKQQLRFAEVGSLYFEVAEKRDPRSPHWVKAGIEAAASWKWMVTGSYQEIFLFKRETLRTAARHARIQTIERGTSQGFTLSIGAAHQLATKMLVWEDREHDGRERAIDPDEMMKAIGRAAFGIHYEGD